MNLTFVLLSSAEIGFLCGLRAFTPVAFICWLAIWGWIPLAGSPFWFFGTTPFAAILSIFALGEFIADKLPKVPARIEAAPLTVRAVTGLVSAACLCFAAGRSWTWGLLCGAGGACLGALAGYHARRFLARRLRVPDLLPALVEDFITIPGTIFLLRHFFSTPV